MLRFFERNSLPTATVLDSYQKPEEAGRALARLGSKKNATWPIFVKACHLTQGSLRSVRMIHNQKEAIDNANNLRCWLRRMYVLRADDRNRPWTRESNELTDTVAPGFAMQVRGSAWIVCAA